MFKHILVPTDGSQFSQDTCRRAVSFAKEAGAKITAFYAKPEYPVTYYGEGALIDSTTPEQFAELAETQALKRPAVLAVSGVHNSGKTTLLEKLLPVLRSRGLKVGVIKHDGHDFTPDVPGTDSYRLREAGAEGVAVYSGTRYLLTEEFRLTEQDLLALFERHGYDLVLLEGFKSSGWPKIEVVRSAISDAPVSFQPLAVVGDIPGADFDLNDIPALADWIEAQMPAL